MKESRQQTETKKKEDQLKNMSLQIIHKEEPNPKCLSEIEEKSFWLEIMGGIIDLASRDPRILSKSASLKTQNVDRVSGQRNRPLQ